MKKTRDGLFYYDGYWGDKPWGCGHWDNKYEIDTRERNMGSSHYGKLEYYHTSMWDKGGVWTHSKTVPSVYYQYDSRYGINIKRLWRTARKI